MAEFTKECREITKYIVNKIRNDELIIGNILPSEVIIAEELEINREIVTMALDHLEKLGLLINASTEENLPTYEVTKEVAAMVKVLFSFNKITIGELNAFRKGMDKMVCSMLLEKDEDLTPLLLKAQKLLNTKPVTNLNYEHCIRTFS